MILKETEKQSFTHSSDNIFFEIYLWGSDVDFF